MASGGEGSRGGKVIGHSKTGRPIYESVHAGAASGANVHAQSGTAPTAHAGMTPGAGSRPMTPGATAAAARYHEQGGGSPGGFGRKSAEREAARGTAPGHTVPVETFASKAMAASKEAARAPSVQTHGLAQAMHSRAAEMAKSEPTQEYHAERAAYHATAARELKKAR